MHPDRVTILASDDEEDVFYQVRNKRGEVAVYPASDFLHLRTISCDGFHGLTPLQLGAGPISLSAQGEQSAHHFFANGSRPSGVLSTDKMLKPGEASEMQQRFEEKYSGPANAHRVAVLEGGLK